MAADVSGGLHRDRISDLPDAILVSILSLLSLDEAARCSFLASRWRHIFPLTLLDFEVLFPVRRSVVNLVEGILAAHPTAPVRSFRTSYAGINGDTDPDGGWLQDLARHGVQELAISFVERQQKIPDSLFACANLTRLRASHCTFPSAFAAAAAMPPMACLTDVELSCVEISGDSLHALIEHCTALERLRMRNMRVVGSVHIRSQSLSYDGRFGELFIEDAPKLEWVLWDNMWRDVHLMVARAPKLEFLGYLGTGAPSIDMGETIFRENQILVKTLMPSLKTLAVIMKIRGTGYINWFMKLLQLFPCLETLYTRSEISPMNHSDASESWNLLTSIPCVDNHLQNVVFEVYRGHEWQRELARFLHVRSRSLETMEFHCMDDSRIGMRPPKEEWVRKQTELLCLDSRASRDARFLFFKHGLPSIHHDICRNHHSDFSEQYKRTYYDHLYEV